MLSLLRSDHFSLLYKDWKNYNDKTSKKLASLGIMAAHLQAPLEIQSNITALWYLGV